MPAWTRAPWAAPAVCAAVALVVRVALVLRLPSPWHFDAYQRWAARDHLVVQVWLPATQALVWLVDQLGGGIFALRMALCLLAALVVGMGAALAGRLGGDRAGWWFLPWALFGPFVTWSTVPYQESTFLAVIFGALLLVRRAPLLADLLVGALALVRYEGWPLLVVWLGLRRDPRALACLWGAALWIALKQGGLAEPHRASPDSFADWNRLDDNLRPRKLRFLADGLRYHLTQSALIWAIPAGVAAAWRWLRRGWRDTPFEAWFLLFAVGGQLAAVTGWAFSLGTTSGRMLVVLGMAGGVLAAVGLSQSWAKWGRRGRIALLFTAVGTTAWSALDGWNESVTFVNMVRWEIDLARDMSACPGDVWAMNPRTNPGPRRRHDACEVIQGVTELRAGRDFACLKWGQTQPGPTLIAHWRHPERRYRVERVGGQGAPTCRF